VDSEEYEQIPWSSLVPEQSEAIDRRVYLAIGVVGVVIAVIFGVRLFGGPSPQPLPPAVVVPQTVADTTVPTTSAVLVVSEADLMASPPVNVFEGESIRVAALAEWFVTDYYTTDGSQETARSLKALFAASAGNPDLPHNADPAPPVTYVEWARSTDVRFGDDDTAEVDVIFRTITESDNGFVRDAVVAVTVTLRVGSEDPGIAGPPVAIPVLLGDR